MSRTGQGTVLCPIQNTVKKLGMKMGKIYLSDFSESLAYSGISEGASKIGKLQYEYYFEKLK